MPADTFNAVVSFSSFDHIPREQHGPLLRRIHDWLRPGGNLLLGVEDADQPGTVTEWLGVEMFFSMFDPDTTRALVKQPGFAIIGGPDPGGDGRRHGRRGDDGRGDCGRLPAVEHRGRR